MIDVNQALARVLELCQPLPTRSYRPLDALGRVLAEDITADGDAPAYDKALVDGYAIRTADAGKRLRVLEQVVAGGVPTQHVRPGVCVQVMTGAPIPEGTEAMVMVEDTQPQGDWVTALNRTSVGG